MEAFKSSRSAVMLVEPMIFAKLKENEESELQNDPAFLQQLQVLLISYHNLGNTQIRLKNKKYAKTVFEHGWKMSKKLLGQDSAFALKFETQIKKHFGIRSPGSRGHSETNSNHFRNSGKRQMVKRDRPFTSHSSSTSKCIVHLSYFSITTSEEE